MKTDADELEDRMADNREVLWELAWFGCSWCLALAAGTVFVAAVMWALFG